MRDLATHGLRLFQSEHAAELLGRIPEAERTPADWLNRGLALGRTGRHLEAVAATRKAIEIGVPQYRSLSLNNLVAHQIRGTSASSEERAGWLGLLADAKRSLVDTPAAHRQGLLASILCTEAEARLILGDYEGSLRTLAESESAAPVNAERLLVRARVYLATGRSDAARADLEEARKTAHPDSDTMKELQALLSSA